MDRHNRWPLCRKYGFISASGGAPYTKPVRNLTGGGRVFAYVGGAGYVGVGDITGVPTRLRDAVSSGAVSLDEHDVPDWESEYRDSPDDDMTTWIVPVEWRATRDVAQAVREKGLFSIPNTVCKLKDDRTTGRSRSSHVSSASTTTPDVAMARQDPSFLSADHEPLASSMSDSDARR